jgi:hypothetical protein
VGGLALAAHHPQGKVDPWTEGMSDEDKLNLRPASAQEIEESLSFALRFSGRKRVHHADDAMARITAERLVQHLERSGFVLMKRPPATPPSTSRHSHPNATD